MYTSFVGLNIDINEEDNIEESLLRMDNVIEIYKMMQPFDLFIKVYADNIRILETTVEEIRKLNGIYKTYNFLAVQQKKGLK
ncbi:hypothetical protein CUJ83_14510 [Methanocella sp. CWC-04]|uniref:Transcription regulator AsnC/Lrp ligand binding domain-containing protein n=1 Tax=Methanooceanicella nereidis TaxID=2052831 RepID=A0AAP2RFM7_9EURY|nr:Lrp/AsnC ligand binding domain-containing protein [Methanocella sp. CWC-04]MCD1296212.1 hypothetical protein [Methanocella sp. CWC-04]